ncbi:MAG: zf-HC2 domain-containing protein [Anaerolineales bacterium]|nr:zf-HC2 domain-containing protein [Anaerolineales bacterium]
MNHEEQLIRYAANQLTENERADFEHHLAECADCQTDLLLWQSVADEIHASDSAEVAPPHLADRALERIHQPAAPQLAFRRVIQLLRSQAPLVQREMFPATAAVMALGVIVAVISKHAEFIYFIAPLMAAASLSILFGPEHDPAHELALSTPTSSWKLLLARLSIVSAYNMFLALAAMLILMTAFPVDVISTLTLGLLAPMAFLSALALLLSIWLGTNNAIIITYILWLAQSTSFQSIGAWTVSPAWAFFLRSYREFWHSPMLLLALTVPVLFVALLSANRPVFRLSA